MRCPYCGEGIERGDEMCGYCCQNLEWSSNVASIKINCSECDDTAFRWDRHNRRWAECWCGITDALLDSSPRPKFGDPTPTPRLYRDMRAVYAARLNRCSDCPSKDGLRAAPSGYAYCRRCYGPATAPNPKPHCSICLSRHGHEVQHACE